MILDYIEEYFWSIIPNPYKIVLVVCGLLIIIIHKYSDEYNINKIQNKIKQYKKDSPKKFFSIVIVAFLAFTYCGYYYVNENCIFPDPPQDQFVVSISPFYLDNSEVDFDTPEEIIEKIENATGGRIEARVLKPPPITNDNDAVFRGQKDGAHLVIYGGQKRRLGDIDEVEFHIVSVPTNLKTNISELTATTMNNGYMLKAKFSPLYI